jgi:hypothetical protein
MRQNKGNSTLERERSTIRYGRHEVGEEAQAEEEPGLQGSYGQLFFPRVLLVLNFGRLCK